MNNTLKVLFLLALFTLSSCVTNKKLNYLQNAQDLNETQTFSSTNPKPYTLRVGDELFIDIKPLYAENASPFSSNTSSGSTRMTTQNAYFYSYPIYEDGNITYPYIGKIHVKDLTLQEARDTITNRFADYLQGMSITVKLSNNFINILGEVNSPGRKQLNTEQVNIFEAIALAGDLDPYAKRAEVKLIRETDNGPVIYTFDLRNKDIVHSEYYWVMPGDIIYVSRIKGQFFKMDSFTDFLALFSSSLSLVLLSLSI